VELEINQGGKPHRNMRIKGIFHQGKIIEKECELQPQDTIAFLTDEIELSTKQIGFLFEKKKNANDGLMITCTKFIHPGYKGGLSGLITNISNKERLIYIDDPILELVLLNNDDECSPFPPNLIPANQRVRELRELSKNFPKSFIDIKRFEERLIKDINTLSWRNTIKLIAVLVSFMAILAAVIGLLEYSANKRVISYITDFEKTEHFNKNTITSKDFKQLQNKINELEKKLDRQGS